MEGEEGKREEGEGGREGGREGESERVENWSEGLGSRHETRCQYRTSRSTRVARYAAPAPDIA
eukprot:1289124-Rhodomonas_salina.1